MKQKQPIGLGHFREIELSCDNPRRHVVDDDETIDGVGMIFCKPGSHTRPPIMSHQGNLIDFQRSHEFA
jgi:hypothetical protein